MKKLFLFLPVFLCIISCSDNAVTQPDTGFTAKNNIAGNWIVLSTGFPDDDLIIETTDSTLTYRNTPYKAVYSQKVVTGTHEVAYDANNYQKYTITITMTGKDTFTGSMHDTYTVNSSTFTRDRGITGSRKK